MPDEDHKDEGDPLDGLMIETVVPPDPPDAEVPPEPAGLPSFEEVAPAGGRVVASEDEAVPPGEGNISESDAGQRIALARDFFTRLVKGIKTIGLYRHAKGKYGEYLKDAYETLSALLDKYEVMPLRVQQNAFRYISENVYEEEPGDQNIAFKFYRDGIRLITFRQGLTAEELLDFVMICLTSFTQDAFVHEDMGSLMWKQDFAHIEHVVMESFVLGSTGLADDEAKIEVDKIVDHLYHGLTSRTSDGHKYAKLSLDDLDIEIDNVEQIGGLVVKASPATAQDQMNVQFQLEQHDSRRMMPRLAEILFEVLEEELDMELAQSIEQAFYSLLDSFILQEDLDGIEALLTRLEEAQWGQLPPGSKALVAHVFRAMLGMMGDQERLFQVAEMLEVTSKPEKFKSAERYLYRLDEFAAGALLGVLESVTKLEVRRMLCDKLASFGQANLDDYVHRLGNPKANVVRDMLYIIDKLKPGNKSRILARLLKHPNLALRLEALKSIGDGSEMEASAYIMTAMKDSDAQVRATAAMLLPNFDQGVAKRTLLAAVKDPGFADKSDREQVAVYAGLAATDAPDALHFFRDELQHTGLIGRKHRLEQKRNMIRGMAETGTISAYRLLNEFRTVVREEELVPVVERACARLRQRLLGESASEADAGGGNTP